MRGIDSRLRNIHYADGPDARLIIDFPSCPTWFHLELINRFANAMEEPAMTGTTRWEINFTHTQCFEMRRPLQDTAKLLELVKSGDILRMKGCGKATRKELMAYSGFETRGNFPSTR